MGGECDQAGLSPSLGWKIFATICGKGTGGGNTLVRVCVPLGLHVKTTSARSVHLLLVLSPNLYKC